MHTPINTVIPCTFLAAVLLASAGCPSGVSHEPPTPAEQNEPTNVPEPTMPLVAAVPAPDYVVELRSHLFADRIYQAKQTAEKLRAEYPDDPWVLAYSGLLLGRSGDAEGEKMLSRALEVATAPNLRAEVRYYQALLLQRQQGFAAGRKAVAASLEEYPLESAKRNLALIDGIENSVPEDAAAVKPTCDRLASVTNDNKGHRTCTGVRVGPTLWAVETRVVFDVVFIRAIYRWYLVEPSLPQGVQFHDDLDTEPDEDQAGCQDEEVLTIDRAHGLAGGVAAAEILKINTNDYLKFDCNTVDIRGGGRMKEIGPSTYTRFCSLESGGCTDPQFTHEVKGDGTIIDRTVEVVDGLIVITPKGGEPQTAVLP